MRGKCEPLAMRYKALRVFPDELSATQIVGNKRSGPPIGELPANAVFGKRNQAAPFLEPIPIELPKKP